MVQQPPTRVERRLSAILAADVAGYSRLMGLDEVGTVRVLREHRAVSDALVAKHGGRIVKTTGDGVLIEFPSVVDAVECAVAVQAVMAEHFGRHPAADIYLSQPGFGVVLAARALGEFGDDTQRFGDARARKNYSGQSPITRASGKKTVVLARYATNRRLGAALHLQAFAALGASPGARCYYDALRGRNIGHHAALRQLANRLVGILHGCLKTGTLYDEDTAWQHHRTDTQTAAA